MAGKRDIKGEDLYFEGREARTYWARFSTLLGISTIIATLGLYRNSGAVVIAAMLIAPLMTPILGIASAVVMGWTGRLLLLLASVIGASVGIIAMAFLILFVIDAPRGLVISAEVMARTDPGLEELMVALAAGIAGAFVQMRKEEAGLLPGVAIGVSLVPPLAAAGMLVYFGENTLAWEAVLLYLTNLSAIVLSASAVFLVLGLRPAMRDKGHVARVGLGGMVTFIVVAILAVDLGATTVQRFREARDEEQVLTAIQDWAGAHPVGIVEVDVSDDVVDIWLVFDVPLHKADEIAAPGELVASELTERKLEKEVRRLLKRDVDIFLRGQLRYAGLLRSRD